MRHDQDSLSGEGGVHRRQFLQTSLQSLLTLSFVDLALGRRALAAGVEADIAGWARRLDEKCQDLRQDAITPLQWQAELESLLGGIALDELLRLIDFDRLTAKMDLPDLGVRAEKISFPRLDGLPGTAAYTRKLFGMRRGRAIIPHGHSNMASAHLVLKGRFDLRHYDRLADEDGFMIVAPTVERTAGAGSVSSVSDARDNVHWFRALSDEAFTFDVIVTNLAGGRWHVQNIDIDAAESLAGGRLRVPKMEVQAALSKYGKDESHHEPG